MEQRSEYISTKFAVTLITTISICLTAASGTRECVFNITEVATGSYAPLLLWNTTSKQELVVPDMGLVTLDLQEAIYVACPGPKNNITLTNTRSIRAICSRNNQLEVFKQKRDFEELKCRKITRGDIKNTNESCGQNAGKLLFIGYEVTKNDFLPLISVCYDERIGNTLYTEHVIYGRAVSVSAKLANKPGFSVNGLGPGIAASSAYEKVTQKASFNRLLKSARLAQMYISGKSYLARGHLSPVADFPLSTSKVATYFFINAVPQWQSINQANWKSLEYMVRKIAENYEQLQIITGTHGILTLPNENGEEIEMFLQSRNKLPVPKYTWKVVYDQESQHGIALVVLNNPFVTEIVEDGLLCDQNVCAENGWGSKSWATLGSGYTRCCTITDFRNSVKSIPKLFVNGILLGPNRRVRPTGL